MYQSITLILIGSLFGILPVSAQENSIGTWQHVHEDVARISQTDLYEKDMKELFAIFQRTGNPNGVTTAQMNGNRYMMFRTLEAPGLEGALAMQNKSEAWYETLSNEDRETMMRLAAPYEETHRSYIVYRSDDFSYVPDTPEASLVDQPYRSVSYNYLYRGKEGEVHELLKRFRALYEEKQIPYRYDVFLPGLGMDGTLLIIMWSARDAEHLEQKYKHVKELMGGADAELQLEAQRMVRNYEELRGVMRPDLSFTPAGN
jgi:hypothetical protein